MPRCRERSPWTVMPGSRMSWGQVSWPSHHLVIGSVAPDSHRSTGSAGVAPNQGHAGRGQAEPNRRSLARRR